ncbi:hypothetical protein EVA24_04780 [bacterium]|nr:MAG: hypothetical protein EVA24_04780 [bacterium]
MKVLLCMAFIFCFSFSQQNSEHIKVVEHKKSWKAYRSGVEIPKSHFFNVLNDEYNRDQSKAYEKKFMNQRFKLSCFMCGNSTLGILSLAASNMEMVNYTLYGYLLSNFLKRILRVKDVDVSYEEALKMANEYNQTISGKGKIAI